MDGRFVAKIGTQFVGISPALFLATAWSFLLLSLVLYRAGFILIYVGNAKTSTVVNSLSVTISGTLDTAIDRLDQAQALASQLPYTNDPSTNQTFADARAKLVEFQSNTVSVSEKVNKYDGIRKAAIFVGSLVPLALTIGGALFMIFNCGKPAMGAVAWFLVFLSILAWLCMGAHLVIGKGLSDVCYEVDLAQAEGETGVLGIIIKCQQNTSELEDVRTTINNGINQATDSACSAMNATCTTSSPAGPVDCEPAPWVCTQSNIDTYPNFTMTDVATSCSDGTFVAPTDSCVAPATSTGPYTNSLQVKDCPTDCRNPDFRSQAAQAMQGLATLNQYYEVAAEVQPLLTCDFVADAFWSAKVTICTTFDRALTLIFVGSALEAAGMGLAMAALVHCFMGLAGGKRDVFNPRDTL